MNIVMIPTYNEAKNIGKLIDTIIGIDNSLHILVVDDNSPDGTGEIVLEKSRHNPYVHLLLRKERRGRGYAGIAGLVKALEMNANKVIEMDADFSHDPIYIPEFLKMLDFFDLVIGSRFIPGGEDIDRGLIRKLISPAASFYQRSILGFHIKDCTSGYRGYRSEALKGIRVETIDVWGPAVLIDILYRIKLKNYKIAEIPIKFKDREEGKSTFNYKIALEGIKRTLYLRLNKSKLLRELN